MRRKKLLEKVISIGLIVLMGLSLMGISVFASDDSWTIKTDMTTERYGLGCAQANGKIYAIGGWRSGIGGVTTLEEYNPTTDSWAAKTSMTTPRDGLVTATVNGKIYAIGGVDPYGAVLNTVEEYDPTTNTWASRASMVTARGQLAVAVVNGKIYTIGGMLSSGAVLNTVEVYDPITNTWASKASMPTARRLLGAATVNDKIYAIGGLNSSAVEEYDPITNSWATKVSMTASRYGMAVESVNNKIYAIGGANKNTVEEYDPIINNWTTKTSMPSSRENVGSAVVNNKIYVIGGLRISVLKNVEEYTPAPTITIPDAPTNLTATAGNAKVDLSWDGVISATSYNVKRSTTSGAAYTTISTGVTIPIYTDATATNGTTYYYVVTSLNSAGESEISNEVTATPRDPEGYIGNRAILEITMTNGKLKEYDLSISQIDAFITWYDNRANGAGKSYYAIKKVNNIKPFLGRKDFIIFDKILDFEVKDYND